MQFQGASGSGGGTETTGDDVEVGSVITLAANGSNTIAASDRLSTTIINYGPGKVYFQTAAAAAATDTYIPSGAFISYGNGAAMHIKADASGATVGWFGEIWD